MDTISIILLALEAGFGLFLLWRAGLLTSRRAWILSLLLSAAAFALRGMAFDYETLDYQNFLHPWCEFFRRSGGFKALATPVGNYNIPYLYFLALFSYLPIRDLYLIKLLSVLFDVLLGWSCAMLTGRVTGSRTRQLACYFTVLFLPTVFLNGAVWGQCDGVYVALAVLGIWLAMDERPVWSMICLTLSFGFKLQAVFVMPLWAVFLMQGKIRWKHLLLFPAAYVLLVLPAVLLGRPFLDTVTLYFSQTGCLHRRHRRGLRLRGEPAGRRLGQPPPPDRPGRDRPRAPVCDRHPLPPAPYARPVFLRGGRAQRGAGLCASGAVARGPADAVRVPAGLSRLSENALPASHALRQRGADPVHGARADRPAELPGGRKNNKKKKTFLTNRISLL